MHCSKTTPSTYEYFTDISAITGARKKYHLIQIL